MARRATAQTASETPSTTSTTRRRLTDADRQKIREFAAEGKSNGEIALEIPTSLATVSKVLTGGAAVRRPRAEQLGTPKETMSQTQRRLINLAVAMLMDEPIIESEKFELKQVIEARIAEARQAAVQHALANL